MSRGPNESGPKWVGAQMSQGPNELGPKCVGAQMSRGPNVLGPKWVGAQMCWGPNESGAQMRNGPKCVPAVGEGREGGKKGTTLYLNCFYPSPDLTIYKQFVLKGAIETFQDFLYELGMKLHIVRLWTVDHATIKFSTTLEALIKQARHDGWC